MRPARPASIRIRPTVSTSTPLTWKLVANLRIAPTAIRNIDAPMVTFVSSDRYSSEMLYPGPVDEETRGPGTAPWGKLGARFGFLFLLVLAHLRDAFHAFAERGAGDAFDVLLAQRLAGFAGGLAF